MNFDFKFGTLAIVVWVNACGGEPREEPTARDDRGAGTGGYTGESRDSGDGYGGLNSGSITGDGIAGRAESSAGRASHGDASSAGGASSDLSNDSARTPSEVDGNAGGGPEDVDSEPAGSPSGDDASDDEGNDDVSSEGDDASDDEDSGDGGGSGGTAGDGAGDSDAAAGFSGGGTGGTGGAGFGGAPATAGSGGVSEVGGTGGGSTNAGSGGAAGKEGGSVSLDPEHLFMREEFGGNGRTCVTCHTAESGTISPAQIQALYAADPDGPLFRSIDSDDGVSDDYTQLRRRATFRVTVDLPPGVFLTSDPSATSIVLRRGVPTTINTPALDPVLMWDGRAPDLISQARDAVLGHAEGTVIPTATQLELIVQFEKGPSFFSNEILRRYAEGGPPPTWPEGVTAEERRGRRWFAPDSAAPRFNICGQCHGGPMTNETQSNSGLPARQHFQTANVSEFNTLGNPVYEFSFPDPNDPNERVTVRTPDPGRALVTGSVRDVNFFKIPPLWGVKNTAPYFHDNSAQTLEELMDHYEKHLATFLFRNFDYPIPHVPTQQDKADIIAYLKLL